MVQESRHISQFIHCDPKTAYDYAVNPLNLSRWASGLSSTPPAALGNGEWSADSPMGSIRFKFVPQNELGVLDHVVTLPDGTQVYNPLRIIRNGDGCEVI
ncbi:MAG: SRPBCC family protein, partial [Proteobacteria bacterium]